MKLTSPQRKRLKNIRTLVRNADSTSIISSTDFLYKKKANAALRRVRRFRKTKLAPKPYTPRLACSVKGEPVSFGSRNRCLCDHCYYYSGSEAHYGHIGQPRVYNYLTERGKQMIATAEQLGLIV